MRDGHNTVRDHWRREPCEGVALRRPGPAVLPGRDHALRRFSGVLKRVAGGVGTFNCHCSLPPGRQGRRQLFEVTSDGFSAYLDLGPTVAESPYGGTGSIIDGTEECPVAQTRATYHVWLP